MPSFKKIVLVQQFFKNQFYFVLFHIMHMMSNSKHIFWDWIVFSFSSTSKSLSTPFCGRKFICSSDIAIKIWKTNQLCNSFMFLHHIWFRRKVVQNDNQLAAIITVNNSTKGYYLFFCKTASIKYFPTTPFRNFETNTCWEWICFLWKNFAILNSVKIKPCGTRRCLWWQNCIFVNEAGKHFSEMKKEKFHFSFNFQKTKKFIE